MAACLGVAVDLIGPAGFDMSDRNFKRAGLDYLPHALVERHVSFAAFREAQSAANRRLVLLTTKAETAHVAFSFMPTDVLMLGRESAGVPDDVHQVVDARVRIPMQPGMRSLNIAVAGAIVLGEALRQTGQFPA